VAIHVGYEQPNILLEGRRMHQTPIDILAKMTHGRISATSGVEARPVETRSTQQQRLSAPAKLAGPIQSTWICHSAAIRTMSGVGSEAGEGQSVTACVEPASLSGGAEGTGRRSAARYTAPKLCLWCGHLPRPGRHGGLGRAGLRRRHDRRSCMARSQEGQSRARPARGFTAPRPQLSYLLPSGAAWGTLWPLTITAS
jgi:hypothetical protein